MSEQNNVRKAQSSEYYDAKPAERDDLAVELAHVARELQHHPPEDLLEAIVQTAVDMIPGVEDGSISLVLGRKSLDSEGATSDLPSQLDAIQMQENEGPCLDAVYEQTTVRVPDIENDSRWPAFGRRVIAETEARGMLAFQLFVEEENLGALNLFSRRPNAFTDDSEFVGSLVAAHAAVAFAETRQTVQLDEAIINRDVIGQAKGILMERYKITGQHAFYLLSQVSSRTNTKLYKVAEQLVTSGELTPEQE